MVTNGSCLCGKIRYQYAGEPLVTALCHCVDCQKWTGSAFTSNVMVSRKDFKVVEGTPKSYDAIGDSGKINKHFFCGDCGSSLFTELEIMPESTYVKAGGLDGGASKLGNKVAVELYTKDRMPYLKPADGAQQLHALN
ncbi:hypothetical protein JX265_012444 [Neoarthrinium moseri]|uniref:CENP-V/GFA domain-containing protein n=1 Tax=Neoarthrinium moseri TaxID=1658444 RepID=A0A9Q0AJJ7_9PEZI|nr:uncharacterized protein JN550_009916 [Neoarthrinium moseri]KAI1854410.1 hypothetical protein JX265_012444 [Neoarthrinium moseri]KAI1862769.1 hypothetical protein JN550_009916 [Neoarthrinium moseri]